MGGSSKSGGAGQTYVYYGTIACGICTGPVDDLISIILNGEEVWPQGTPWTGIGGTSTAGTLYVYDAQTWVCSTTVTNTTANAPGGSDLTPGWTQYTLARPALPTTYTDISISTSDGTYYGILRFYWGTSAQTVDPYLTAGGNDGPGLNGTGGGDQHPNYAGVCYCILIDFMFGQEIQSAPNIEIVVRKAPAQTVVTGSEAALDANGQANLAAAVAQILTDENCIGLPAAALDATTFNAAAVYLDSVSAVTNASLLVDSTETLRSVLQKITDLCDGYVRMNPATGLIEMGVYQHGVTPATYVTLTEDALTEAPKLSPKSWQSAYSRATVRYPDRQINYQTTSLHADDARAWFVLKTVREMSLDRPYITMGTQALAHGREMLRLLGTAQLSATVSVRREFARTIIEGGYVLLDVDIEPNLTTVYQYFRVTKMTIPMTGPVKLELFADNTLSTVPALSVSAPVVPLADAVPPITQFRFLEVPTILSDERGAITVLAQRPTNILTGCQLYFDTSPTGTFSSLGTFPIFAAYSTIHTAINAGDSTITVSAAAQVDLAWLETSYSANDQANDTLLAILLTLVPSGTDAGEIAESSGYQEMEICSVGTITLVSAGVYTLSVLRGRQNTEPMAVATTHSECWIIPRSSLAYFNSSLFDTIRANRVLGATPAYAQFRLCPYTFVAQLPLSDATSEQFRFPLASASVPALTLTAPASFAALSYPTVTTYPFFIPVVGTWTDPDGALAEIIVSLRLSTEASDRVIIDQVIPACASKSFSTGVQITSAGSYTLKLISRDSFNLSTEIDIPVSVAGSGAKCALVDAFDVTGKQILDGAGSPANNASGNYATYSAPWICTPSLPTAFGPITLRCATPGATIHFSCFKALSAGSIVTLASGALPGAYGTYSASYQPYHNLSGSGTNDGTPTQLGTFAVLNTNYIYAYATAPGYTDSDVIGFVLMVLE